MPGAVLQLRQHNPNRARYVTPPDILGDIDRLVLLVRVINKSEALDRDKLKLRARGNELKSPPSRPPEVEIIPSIGLGRAHPNSSRTTDDTPQPTPARPQPGRKRSRS
ncbi:hypothetical protein [Streptomyces europaeiscabiei]|uniref:Transposase n=1 Tax=Streptomyces europaeiscabiei TaxID=146819 RepID=A0ABU4NVK9_9ACTN|nr:hypothetical protein [Streptomyces europaeiscabiei]MDX2772915.1 hypothetical protein [Streptomyces europaeiscabiei]MDX3549203.1 hypothetical protein [Streptomyces europaeiscabiei]MDX3558672.1 hypothetical protein [Streptomyces europaeiscabiei]MDX3673358.1 hypothetical protein [Streptomyces europaeiscabiei]MDX3706409.1 hypothetical protein [Streptomyces europaeiscabiei]